MNDVKKEKYTWSVFFKLLKSTKPSSGKIVFGLFFNGISAILASLLPLFLQQLIDGFSSEKNQSFAKVNLMLIAVIFVLQAVAQVAGSYSLNLVGIHMITNLRSRLWSKIVKLPKNFFDKNNSGEISSRIVNDTSMIYDLVSREFAQFVNAMIYMSIGVVMLLILDWKLSILILMAIPLFFIIFIPTGKILSVVSKNIQNSVASLNERAFQMTSENTLTKICTAESFEIGKGIEKINDLQQYSKKQIKIIAFLTPIINFIVMSLILLIITYGGVRVANGTLSVGSFIGIVAVVVMIINPISSMGSFFSELQRTKGATERISDILNERTELLNKGNDLDIGGKSLYWENIDFSYKDKRSEFTLDKINMAIKVGSKCAIVGPSGAGKSTILALLERLYDVDSGEILLGKQDIKNISLSSWRSQIGYVSQENDLISGTIKDNILYGLEGTSSEEAIINACKSAFAWEFIDDLPDKLSTFVGERGVMLSVGQRQRIAIARTFLRNPNILLLDEATANLDSDSEKKIQEAVDNVMKNRTVIAVAHRLSTIINSDRIYFIENGVITGCGTHDELLSSHLMYQQFYRQQVNNGK